MDNLSIQVDGKIREHVEIIIKTMKCERGFECVNNGFQNLCRVKNFSGGDFPECREAFDCQYKLHYGFIYLCKCPLRIYMAKRFAF